LQRSCSGYNTGWGQGLRPRYKGCINGTFRRKARRALVTTNSVSSPGDASAYRPDIDGLRALSIGAVVIYHAFPEVLRSGFVGVDVFFVISGFLITSVIASDLETCRYSLASFYERRVRRLFPAPNRMMRTDNRHARSTVVRWGGPELRTSR